MVDPVPLGLIAGEGVFPLLVARGARAAGRRVVCVAFGGHAWPELEQECDQFRWVGVVRLNQWIRTLRSAGCREAVMVGRVAKGQLYDRWRYLRYIPDLRSARFFWARRPARTSGLRRSYRPSVAEPGRRGNPFDSIPPDIVPSTSPPPA